MPDTDTKSLEETLGALYDAAEAGESGSHQEVVQPETPAVGEVAHEAGEVAGAGEDAGELRQEKAPAQKERPALPQDKGPKGKGVGPQPGAPGAAPEALKPPADWKPGAREKWATLPREVQEEALRVHREAKKVLQSAAEHRKVAEGFQKAVEPYRGLLQGEPLHVVGSLLQTAARLRTGTPAERAAVAAEIIAGYNVDVEMLASVLEGKAPPQQAKQPAQFRDPRFDAFLGQLQQAQQQRNTAVQSKAAEELEAFAANAEFLNDVREDMADILAMARKRGQKLTLQQAYDRACALNEEVRPLWEQRKATQAAANAPSASTRTRTRVSSSSLRHEPSLPSPGKPRSLTADIEAAYDALAKGP